MIENNELQVKNSLCPISQVKILKGAIIALSGAVVSLCLLLAWGIGIDRAAISAFLTWIVPTGVNLIHQFMKGESVEV